MEHLGGEEFRQKWERAVLLELNREYQEIVRERRLQQLRPVLIELSDSQSHWGQWDSEKRIIFLSRRLIENHCWYYVQAVLRHEMAHQLADQSCDPTKVIKPHGEEFKQACRRLGVPEPFCHAQIDLQSHSLEKGAEENLNSETQRLLEKARKLLALASSSNEHEAALAMNKVRELYAKYNLENKNSELRFHHLIVTHKKKRFEAYHSQIVSILVGHFFVRAIFFGMYDAQSGERHRAFELIGRRENVLMAEHVYYFLLQQCESLLAKRAQDLPLTTRARKSYRMGILQGFSEKLLDAERVEKIKQASNVTSDVSNHCSNIIRRALVQFNGDRELQSYISQIHPRLITSTSRSRSVDRHEYNSGRVMGRSISINKPISGPVVRSGRFLPGR